MARRWTDAEDELLRSMLDRPYAEIAARLDRTIPAVQTRVMNGLEAKSGRGWTPEQIKLLKRGYGRMKTSELARRLNRTPQSIYHQAGRLGLKDHPATTKVAPRVTRSGLTMDELHAEALIENRNRYRQAAWHPKRKAWRRNRLAYLQAHPDDPAHGKRASYDAGCRCGLCEDARSAAEIGQAVPSLARPSKVRRAAPVAPVVWARRGMVMVPVEVRDRAS